MPGAYAWGVCLEQTHEACQRQAIDLHGRPRRAAASARTPWCPPDGAARGRPLDYVDPPLELRNMCGIVGAIANRDVVPVLIEGLKRLEYRGYDSAGIAIVDGSDVRRVRRTGRVAEMEAAAAAERFTSQLGIGHTRWATHGGVT